jgi:hypothetical protein
MEFHDHDGTGMIMSPGNMYMRGQNLDQVYEFGKCREDKGTKIRFRETHSVCLLACDFNMIRQKSIAIHPENQMIPEMQEFVKFSEHNIIGNHR